MRTTIFAGAVAAAVVLSGVCHAKEPVPGFDPHSSAASTLPVFVVAEPDRLHPQLAYGFIQTPGVQTYGSFPGMTLGQTAAVGVAGGLIASALINGAEYTAAKNFARPPYALLQAAHCDLPLESGAARLAEVVRANWLTPSVEARVVPSGDKLADVVPANQPRYVLHVSSSWVPDFSALMTTVEAEGYAPDERGRAASRPAWHDTLIVVSDRSVLPPKTPADIEEMAAAENARYAALDLAPMIRRVNAAGPGADRIERRKVAMAISEHQSNLRDAQRPDWTATSRALRQAGRWAQQDCAALHAALEANLAQAGTMVASLFRGDLPAPAPESADAPAEIEGERSVLALPGRVFLSRRGGDGVPLGYRNTLLPD